MKAVCVSNTLTVAQVELLGAPQANSDPHNSDLVVGAEYVVFGLRVLDGQPWIDVVSQLDYLYPVPLVLFRLTDPRVSRYWVYEQDFELRPEAFSDPYFYDDLSEQMPDAIELFDRVRALMEAEADAPAVPWPT